MPSAFVAGSITDPFQIEPELAPIGNHADNMPERAPIANPFQITSDLSSKVNLFQIAPELAPIADDVEIMPRQVSIALPFQITSKLASTANPLQITVYAQAGFDSKLC